MQGSGPPRKRGYHLNRGGKELFLHDYFRRFTSMPKSFHEGSS